MNPRVVPRATKAVISGLKNMAAITGTCAASVNEAGPIMSLTGIIIGIKIPSAVSIAAIIRFLTFAFFV